MVKVRYTYNNKIVEKDVYETALIVCDMKNGNMEPFESLEPICDSENLPSLTSTSIINEQPPPINNEAPPNINNENVMMEAGGARDGIPPVAVIENIIGEYSRPFVKQLTKSDLKDDLGRLTLQKEFVNCHLVPMFNDDEDLIQGIDVIVYDSQGRQYNMMFKVWSSKLYVLTKSWKEFYKANNLTEAGEYVSVWMFRHIDNHKLCFAIIRGRPEEH